MRSAPKSLITGINGASRDAYGALLMQTGSVGRVRRQIVKELSANQAHHHTIELAKADSARSEFRSRDYCVRAGRREIHNSAAMCSVSGSALAASGRPILQLSLQPVAIGA
jgi:hypothetical protein